MKILLSVYSVKIYKVKDEQLLSKFGGNVDFLPFFHKFTKHIYKNVQHWDKTKQSKLSFTCPTIKDIILSDTERTIYGYFEAGHNGEDFKIKDFQKDKRKFKRVRKTDSSMRGAFFYLLVPKASKSGYLILQVPDGKGIKKLLEHSLREYINLQGLQAYHVEIKSLINEKVFYSMIDKGLLKDMTFTKYGIPENIEDLNNSNTKPVIGGGSIKTIYHDYDLGKPFKNFVKTLFAKKRTEKDGDARSVIEFNNIKADELTVKIEFDGKQKTFHVENFGRTLPDIDVTDEVLNNRNEVDINKLIIEAKALIDEVTDKITENDIK